MERTGISRTGKAGGALLRIGALLLLLFLLQVGRGAAEPTGEQVTGYFVDHTYLRPAMVQTTDYVDVFPPYTIVTLDVVNGTWALYTSPRGKTGYVRYDRILPVPEYEKEEPGDVYSEKRIEIRPLPKYEAPVIYRAEPYELLTLDGRLGGYVHVTAGDGTGGYILPDWVKAAEFTPEPISPVTLVTASERPLLDMPLRGGRRIALMSPGQFYRAEGACGNYYALTLEDGRTAYVEKDLTAVCAYRGGDSRVFFTLPRIRGRKREDAAENVFSNAQVRAEGAVLYGPAGRTRRIPGGTRIYVYSGYGAWYGVLTGAEAGYLRKEDAELLTGEKILARLKTLDLSGGAVIRNELLDRAFTMVERGNPFQARYNLLTGARIESLFTLGVPYFWGGRNYRTLTERLPEYTTREAWQSSPVFYRKGTVYIYGFDCIGFVKSVYSLAGKGIQGTVSGRRAPEYCLAGEHVYCDDVHPLPSDWTEAARTMRVGDIMLIHHPGTHAMMYMGTLRDYGYTAEQLPALADYLDYPLMLQCGENPYSYQRFQSLIRSSADARTAAASPADGGVGVCILGVPREAAELQITCHDETYPCFDVEGSCVTIMNFGNVRDYFVYRMGADSPAPGASGEPEDETEAAGDDLPGNEAPVPETPEEPGEDPEGTGDDLPGTGVPGGEEPAGPEDPAPVL